MRNLLNHNSALLQVFVLKHKPRDSIRPRLLQSPAAAAAAASVTAAYAVITATDDKNIHATSIESNIKGAQAERPPEVVAVDTHAISAEKKMLESRLVEVRDGNSRLQASLDEMNNSHTELLKVNFYYGRTMCTFKYLVTELII